MRILMDDGGEYQVVRYGDPGVGEHFVNQHMLVEYVHVAAPLGTPRLIVRPIAKRHTFGGAVFEETGEEREINGEWGLMMTSRPPLPVFVPGKSFATYRVLRPVAIEEVNQHEGR